MCPAAVPSPFGVMLVAMRCIGGRSLPGSAPMDVWVFCKHPSVMKSSCLVRLLAMRAACQTHSCFTLSPNGVSVRFDARVRWDCPRWLQLGASPA